MCELVRRPTIRRLWWGFAIGLAAQLLWVAYALTTHQLGFILSATGYGTAYAIGAREWWRTREADQ
ncbi:hypothetical protein [Speluncibacter jeojiensis]|uniref:hypothetical protein n=1 Tax=Speluncibacter jeojiensis TaxID=2710754 RepID=UPI0024105ECE|nr:hypothetical protein [Rhodococcus sp. D2-41]